MMTVIWPALALPLDIPCPRHGVQTTEWIQILDRRVDDCPCGHESVSRQQWLGGHYLVSMTAGAGKSRALTWT